MSGLFGGGKNPTHPTSQAKASRQQAATGSAQVSPEGDRTESMSASSPPNPNHMGNSALDSVGRSNRAVSKAKKPAGPGYDFSLPLGDWSDEQLNAYIPMIGDTRLNAKMIADEKASRVARKDYLARTQDQPGRKQTVQSTRAPGVLGKPIL